MRDEIKTDRLVLRQVRFEDAQQFSTLGGDFDIARMTGSFPHPFPLLSAEFKVMDLQHKRKRGLAFPYAITQDCGKMMGIMDLFRKDITEPLEIGYWVGRPYWGQGYATEAAKAIIAEARKTLGVTTLMAGVFEDNPGSICVLQKLGFRITGRSAPYFSMARLANAEGFDMKLCFEASNDAGHCTHPQNSSLQAMKGRN